MKPPIKTVRLIFIRWLSENSSPIRITSYNVCYTKLLRIYGLIKELALYPGVHDKVTIEWHYEKGDEELFELGKIIHTFINCPFLFYEIERA